MTVKITKPSINVREKLSELDKETGIKGEELLRADTSAEAREALQLDQQLFTDFESTGIDDNATSTAVTIDSAGSVYIGSTSDSGTGYHRLSADGFVRHKRAAEIVAIFDRGTSDGNIVQFRKDSTTVGSIASVSGSYTMYNSESGTGYLGVSGAATYAWDATRFYGNADASRDLGSSSRRFKNLYLSGGVYLGGTGAANQLDDYEEGTFTPTLFGTGSSATALLTALGRYVKVGKSVTCWIQIACNGSTTLPTGNYISLAGLPFTPVASRAFTSVIDLAGLTGLASGTFFVGSAFGTNTTINLNKYNQDGRIGSVGLTGASLTSTFSASASITYEVA